MYLILYLLVGLIITTAIFYYSESQDFDMVIFVFIWSIIVLAIPPLLADYLKGIKKHDNKK